MIAKIVGSGRGGGGLTRYITHDAPTSGDRRPETDSRVAWSEALNLDGAAVEDAPARMRATIAAAPALKAAAGVSARGRKLKNQFVHLVLSWPAGEQPGHDEAREAVTGALEAAGYGGHQAVVAMHTDTDHHHAHVCICAVDPATGRARAPKRPTCLALSRWAQEHERAHGGIVIESRVARNAARDARATVAAGLETAGIPPAEAARDAGQSLPLPPTARCGRRPRPGPGRPALTEEETAEWRALYSGQHCRAERVRLAGRQRKRRRRPQCRHQVPAPPDRAAVQRRQFERARPHLARTTEILRCASKRDRPSRSQRLLNRAENALSEVWAADLPAPSDLIAAAVASPGKLPGYRRAFADADPRAGVRRLALDVADPELIRFVAGKKLSDAWVKPLEEIYAGVRGKNPAQFREVDEVWRQQRQEWIPAVRERKAAAAPGAVVDPQTPPRAAQRPPQAPQRPSQAPQEPSFRPPQAAQRPPQAPQRPSFRPPRAAQSPPQAAQSPPQAAQEPSFRPPQAPQRPPVAAPKPDRGGGQRPGHRHDGPSRSGPSR